MNEQALQLILAKLESLENLIRRKESITAPLYMSITDAAKRYGMCRTTFYDLMALDNAPKVVTIGTKRMLPIAEWDAYIRDFDNAQAGLS